MVAAADRKHARGDGHMYSTHDLTKRARGQTGHEQKNRDACSGDEKQWPERRTEDERRGRVSRKQPARGRRRDRGEGSADTGDEMRGRRVARGVRARIQANSLPKNNTDTSMQKQGESGGFYGPSERTRCTTTKLSKTPSRWTSPTQLPTQQWLHAPTLLRVTSTWSAHGGGAH